MNFEEKILNRSNIYRYYKNKVETLKKIQLKQKKEINKLNNQIIELNNELINNEKKFKKLLNAINDLNVFSRESHVEILSSINSVHNFNKNLSNANNLLDKEIKYALIFNDTINDSIWLKKRDFSLNNGAANYSFMYVLYRLLNEVNPKNILELGLGQTSKLTSQFANFYDDVELMIIESDQDWINNFSKKLNISDNISIVHNEVEIFSYKNTDNIRFCDLNKVVGDKKFDLIIIDGPQGFFSPDELLEYSRSNVWDLIPYNLANDFIIVIDDFERTGEKNTIMRVKELLDENNIKFYTFTSFGLKEQHVIASEKYKFVSWF